MLLQKLIYFNMKIKLLISLLILTFFSSCAEKVTIGDKTIQTEITKNSES